MAEGEKIAKAEGVQVEIMLKEGILLKDTQNIHRGQFDLIVIGAKGK